MGNSITKQQAQQGLGLQKFRLLRVIGRGSFGKVRIVEHRDTGKSYALKYISKATCINMKAHVNTIRERDMLEEIDHPFIVNLRFSFQDEYYMLMVMDLMIGGDLRFHMMRRRFVEGVVKFWIAELACAIHCLHTNHHIIHRDIKPDNILIDDSGHVALTDFNIATRVVDDTPHCSVAGTANYMAPEVVSGAGYTYSVDWWSLGVVMYEFIYGKRPFKHKKNTDSLKHALLYEEIQFPIVADVQISYDCISALRGFLNKDISKRLGCGPNGYEAVKGHPFFASIDWTLLETKQTEPPFVPSSQQSNFDIAHDLEEMLLESEPLEAKKRSALKKSKAPPEHSTPAYREISGSFAAFDYIEYERFKRYIDTHGSICALATDAAQVMATSKSKFHSKSAYHYATTGPPPPLAELKLDGRPIIDVKAAMSSAASPSSSYLSPTVRSRTGTSNHIENSSASPGPRSEESLRSWNHVNSGNLDELSYHSSSSKNRRFNIKQNNSDGSINNPAMHSAISHPQHSNLPIGTLEPPANVPIDIATWNQLLPEQRSLAHRYCIKMEHDRQRIAGINLSQLNQEAESRILNSTTPSSRIPFPATTTASKNKSGSEGEKLLSYQEKRKSMRNRQHSFDNSSVLSAGGNGSRKEPSLLGAENGRPFDMGRYCDFRSSVQKKAIPIPVMPLPIPPTEVSSIDSTQHYIHQPLPPPPPVNNHMAFSSPAANKNGAGLTLNHFILPDYAHKHK